MFVRLKGWTEQRPGQESGGRDRVLTGQYFPLDGDGGGWVRCGDDGNGRMCPP